MNKLFTKIATACVGLAMAVGVGVAVGQSPVAVERVDAADATIGDNTYEIAYQTGFESSESFSSSSTYNNTSVQYSGPTGGKWGRICGTPATNDALTGSQSMQMRWYSDKSTPYVFTNFSTENVKAIQFNYKVSNTALHFKVQQSADGSNWSDIEEVTKTSTTKTTYSKEFASAYSNFYLRIYVTGTKPSSGNYKFLIDDVVFGREKTFGTLDHVKITTQATNKSFSVGEKFSSAGLVLTAYDNATEADANTLELSSGFTTTYDNHIFEPSEKGNNKTVTVTYSGKSDTYTISVSGGDVLLSYSHSPFGSATEASSDKATVTVDGIQYESKYGYNYSTNNSLEFDKNTDAYLGNVTAYSTKNISKIVVRWQAYNNSNLIDVYDCAASLDTSSGSKITASDSGLVSTYNFGDTNQFFRINVTGTAYFVEVSSIVIFYGSTHKVVSGIAVKTAPTKTAYIYNEDFDATGLVITVTYSDESFEDVAYLNNENKFSFSPEKITSSGNVTITYSGKTCTQAVTLLTVKSVTSVASHPAYVYVGGSVAGSSVTLNVLYSDNTTVGTVAANHVVVNTTKAAASVEATAWYTSDESDNTKKATFNIEVRKQFVQSEGAYYQVTDVNSLATGDHITIANSSASMVMKETATNNVKGNASSVNATYDYLEVAQDGAILDIELEKTGNYYMFKVSGGYLYASSNSKNYLQTAAQKSTAEENNRGIWNISINNGVATIASQSTLDDARNIMRQNDNNDSPIFACYTATKIADPNFDTNELSIFKYRAYEDEALEYAELFIDGAGNRTCAETIGLWGDLATEYGKLTPGAKDLFAEATHDADLTIYASNTEATIENTVARYDCALIEHSELRTNEFMGRFGEGKANPSFSALVENSNDVNSTSAMIAVISIIGVTAIGGYFLLRKKKEQ